MGKVTKAFKFKSNEKGVAHLLLLISAVGLIAFLFISNTFSFKDHLFASLFPKPSSHAAGAVEINLSPSQTSVALNSQFSVDVNIVPNTEKVVATELIISFDPKILQAVSITPKNAMPTVLKDGNIGSGSVSITLATGPGVSLASNEVLANIVFKVIATTAVSSTIKVDSLTQVSAIGKTTNVAGILGSTQISSTDMTAPPSTPGPTRVPSTPVPSMYVLPTSAPSSTPQPSGTAKKVFVTSVKYKADLGGLTGADSECLSLANSAGLGGKWRAWLSNSQGSPATRMIRFNGQYRLTNGTVVANSWSDLVDGNLRSPINRTEKGELFEGAVWTNTKTSGNTYTTTNHCQSWSTTSNTVFGEVGNSSFSDSRWTVNNVETDCSSTRALYCVEQ